MIGKRVKLVKTEYHDGGGSSLREGDEGTIIEIRTLPQRLGGNRQFWIKWDKTGLGTLALIEDDRYWIIILYHPLTLTVSLDLCPVLSYFRNLVTSQSGVIEGVPMARWLQVFFLHLVPLQTIFHI